MKKKTNLTSILGLAVELAAMLIMLGCYLNSRIIPDWTVYAFAGGLIITIAGSMISIRQNKKK